MYSTIGIINKFVITRNHVLWSYAKKFTPLSASLCLCWVSHAMYLDAIISSAIDSAMSDLGKRRVAILVPCGEALSYPGVRILPVDGMLCSCLFCIYHLGCDHLGSRL